MISAKLALTRTFPLLSRAGALVAMIALVGLLPWLSGRDPAWSVLRAQSAEREATPEALAAIRERLGLDAGPLGLLGHWLAGLWSGDLGTSWVSGKPVLPGLLGSLGVSLTLMGGAIAVALVVAAALAARVLADASRGEVHHRSGAGAAMFTAVPEFVLGSGLMVVFAVWLRWAPPYGWAGPENLVLPAIAMGLPAGGLLGRLLQDALQSAAAEAWTRTWLVLGARRATVAAGVLRRGVPSLLPQLALVVVGLLGGAVAVEELFAVPGVGRLALGAAIAQDLPALQAALLALLVLGVLAGTVFGLAQLLLLGPALRGASIPAAAEVRARPGRVGRALPVVLGGALLIITVAGLLRDPTAVDTSLRLAAPSWAHPFGADALGRDVLARLGRGAVRTVLVAAAITAVSLAVGLVLGLLPGISGPVEVINAVPPVVAGLLTAAILGPGVFGAAAAVAAVAWAPLAAHTSALVREELATTYVRASRTSGAGGGWIMRRHVLPAVLPPVARHALLRLPGVALHLSSLGFLGLGAQPPVPEWGLLLSESMPYVERAPWAVLAPTVALAVLGAFAISVSTTCAPRPDRGRES
ncbi:ABC transporter permease subunit [Saccharopolyspora griseoalba]|uniref:ABC transporter permease subunit n=1 Tax=Saccharopolyspora griseoalba TaxID=1431848 RepID=A0ABW2LFI3_9PSEU